MFLVYGNICCPILKKVTFYITLPIYVVSDSFVSTITLGHHVQAKRTPTMDHLLCVSHFIRIHKRLQQHLKKEYYSSSICRGYCLNSLCCVSRPQASTRIPNPYHTVTACDRVISRYLYQQDYLFYCRATLCLLQEYTCHRI